MYVADNVASSGGDARMTSSCLANRTATSSSKRMKSTGGISAEVRTDAKRGTTADG